MVEVKIDMVQEEFAFKVSTSAWVYPTEKCYTIFK